MTAKNEKEQRKRERKNEIFFFMNGKAKENESKNN